MNTSSVSSASLSRPVSPTKNTDDRKFHSSDERQVARVENKDQQPQASRTEEKKQQNKEDNQHLLDARLLRFAKEPDDISIQQKKLSFNRSRLNDAYNISKNEFKNSNKQHSPERDVDVIDIVV